MYLPVPNLDDRDFKHLLDAAWARIHEVCPDWTDRSPHDPGAVLLEAFAYLTEVMIYRLNRLPDKAYVAFLNLLGTSPHPPSAASVMVEFVRADGTSGPLVIPRGTQVVTAGGAGKPPVTFTAVQPVSAVAGSEPVRVLMHHCEFVEGELIGVGNGQGGQIMQTKSSPIVHTSHPDEGVMLAVEVSPNASDADRPFEFAGRVFEAWERVGAFTGSALGRKCYLIDLATGVITFAPRLDLRPPGWKSAEEDLPPDEQPDKNASQTGGLIADVPGAGLQVRLWYATGGGPDGNVAANTLTRLVKPIDGVKEVGNPISAQGGLPAEPLEAALLRGPYEFFSRQRAVTARDFEMLAISGRSEVARAYAFTSAEMFRFAPAGQVDVVLVPEVTRKQPDFRLSVEEIFAEQQSHALDLTKNDLDNRRALGTSVRVSWAKYKAVSIKATVVVQSQQHVAAVRKTLHERLYQMISPLPADKNTTGWKFGEPLRLSNVYRALEGADPAVRYVNGVSLLVDSVPYEQVGTVAADQYQPLTFYAGAKEMLFRSTNAGRGWEEVKRFTGETVRHIAPAPARVRPGIVERPGWVAAVTERSTADGITGSRVWVSKDLGDAWHQVAELAPRINDVAWSGRDGNNGLLLATDAGLFELALGEHDAMPLPIQVDAADADRGFYAVCAFVSEHGERGVALAALGQLGTYLSLDEGRSGTFRHIGLNNVDTRTLAVQYDGPTTWLWTGVGEADPQMEGQGCFRARLYEADVAWQSVQAGWKGGTCRALVFSDRMAVAATHRGGVMFMDTGIEQPAWQSVGVNCGLPLRDPRGFEPVEAIAVMTADPRAAEPVTAADPNTTESPANPTGLLLAGGAHGVYRSADLRHWKPSANRDAGETVTIPGAWLICSGEHDIEVTTRDETRRD
ncbi:hypothetical protein Rhe02_03080 [Rhizocola hellebori]|uniref:Baseplate assembly protein n=1 Tax=Rhizocola hellebori TaxID=1392758 RepID=A0A8J3Q2N2_9ACTN|nr:baseplate J/gp47 family protein [Rhizocola hellebori]GIH02241.1 hypothetical protein Rhe02_03080 [Rhizocola hellebori]